MLEVGREQVLAHRIAAQGLHRDRDDAASLTVFDLGLQSTQRDTAAISLAARLPGAPTEGAVVADPRFVLAWTHRGAPHFHRADEIGRVAAALVPLDDADAAARMGWQRRGLEAAGMPAADALFTTARALRKAVTGVMPKGAASEAVTRMIPAGLSAWCRGCGATHVLEQLMRLAAIHGGVRLEAGTQPATLAPLPGRTRMRTSPDVDAATAVVRNYLRLHGPATAKEVAGFVGTTATAVRRMWPDDLVEVRVAGRRTWLPRNEVAALENPPEPDLVRLLPPWDPFLQSRDRDVLVPDRGRQREVWRILGNPGVLLADGEVAGVWRAKGSGRRRLEVAVRPFAPLPPPLRTAAEEEAERVARVRGFADLRVGWG